MRSVLELAHFHNGDTAYWVTLVAQSVDPIKLGPDDHWILKHHPKALYERGFCKTWPQKVSLPRLHATDFDCIVGFLTSKLSVEPFEVVSTRRDPHDGAFYYLNEAGDEMPEAYLFDSEASANLEKNRLLRLIRRWASGYEL